jgi:hypothetical protein
MRRWGTRFGAYAVSIIVVALVLSPVVRPGQPDSFPLSTYPMFSNRLGRTAALSTAVGLTATGDVRRLSPELISGGYEPVRAYATVDASIAHGDTDALCDEIAERTRKSGAPDIVAIEVVTETHDVIAWFDGDKDADDRYVYAHCELPDGDR